jgi:hypothetical protein
MTQVRSLPRTRGWGGSCRIVQPSPGRPRSTIGNRRRPVRLAGQRRFDTRWPSSRVCEHHIYGIWAAASWDMRWRRRPRQVARYMPRGRWPAPPPAPWWGRRLPSEPGFVLSPGGWTPPPGVLPAWNWLPSEGAAPRLDLVPWWARVWYHLPFIDRYAHAWMWRNGAWEVRPPNTELGHIGGTD